MDGVDKGEPSKRWAIQFARGLRRSLDYWEMSNCSKRSESRPRTLGKKWPTWSVGLHIVEDTVVVTTTMEVVVVEATEAVGMVAVATEVVVDTVGGTDRQNTSRRRNQRIKPTITVTVWALMEITHITNRPWTSTKTPRTTSPPATKQQRRKDSPKLRWRPRNLLKRLPANCQNLERESRWK